MSDDIDVLKPETIAKPKVEQPRMYKVLLLNDDYTPREFVVMVLKAVFRTTEDQAYRIMMTAHQKGVCVVAVFTRQTSVPQPPSQRFTALVSMPNRSSRRPTVWLTMSSIVCGRV